MTYVDLNPVRANMAPGLNRSKFTTVRKRHRAVLKQPEIANQPLIAMVGVNSLNMPLLTNADYLQLVDYSGRLIYPANAAQSRKLSPRP